MTAAVIKTCGSCANSIPSTVESMTGFAWCTKRNKVGGNMEAVFYNPDWKRECAAFAPATIPGELGANSPVSDKDGLLPSTGALTTSIPIVIPSAHVLVQSTQPTRPMTKMTQTLDLFADLFM